MVDSLGQLTLVGVERRDIKGSAPFFEHTRFIAHFFTMRLRLCTILVALGIVSAQSADSFFNSEVSIAKTNLLANIGPSGAKVQGAHSGVVIASPSTTNPDYLYTWTRDSALVFQEIVNE